MKRKRYTDEQIAYALRQGNSRKTPKDRDELSMTYKLVSCAPVERA